MLYKTGRFCVASLLALSNGEAFFTTLYLKINFVNIRLSVLFIGHISSTIFNKATLDTRTIEEVKENTMIFDEVTVAQFCNLYVDGTDTVRIWHCDEQATVFEGTFCEAMDSEYADYEALGFGIEDGVICINI